MQAISNIDETPMTFDMPLNCTDDAIGNKTILDKTSGHEKDHFTVVLACLADGTKLKHMVILKRKTMPKQLLPSGVVHVHPRGWMDEDGMKLWIRKVWCAQPGGLMKRKSLLVFDSFRAHPVPGVEEKLCEENTDICVIPGGSHLNYSH